jgi:hypothetical protein
LYPIEFETVVRRIVGACGISSKVDLDMNIQRLMNEESPQPFSWYNGQDLVIHIEREEDLWRPIITLVHAYADEPNPAGSDL